MTANYSNFLFVVGCATPPVISSTCCVLPQKRKPTELPPRPHHAAATITTPSLGFLELQRLLLLEEHPLPNQVHRNLKVGGTFLLFFYLNHGTWAITNKNISSFNNIGT